MCGIVGHIGSEISSEVVLEGLKRLEYRGYDSAGISFVSEEKIQFYKKTGKLEKLLEVLKDVNTRSNICIGHTRWATHGGVNDQNSHPHLFENISMVHNGIIENADEIKSNILKGEFEFLSETDSEVFLALVIKYLKEKNSFLESVAGAFRHIKGNSAFVVMNSETKEIIAVKKSAPLACGLRPKTNDKFVSSDPYALVGYASEIYFPGDSVLCFLSSEEKIIRFYDLDLNETENFQHQKADSNDVSSDKGEFEHYMLKEIYEQPELIKELVGYYLNGNGASQLDKFKNKEINRFLINACGTAYYAGLLVVDYSELLNQTPACAYLSSEFRYRNPLFQKNDAALFISQSGETADTLAAAELSKKNNLPIFSLVNVRGSTLYRLSDENLLIKAGTEIGVASTKAFTQMALTGRLLVAAMGGELDDDSRKKSIEKKYLLLSERIKELLDQVDKIKEISESLYNKKGYLFTGRGIYYPVALEGALKLKEIAYVHAEGYASGELKHGPIALIDEEMVNIAIAGPELLEKTISNIQEVKARKGIILTIGPGDNEELKKISDYYIPLNFSGLEEMSPLYVNIVQQLLSYYMAKFKGNDIDQPRNLAKSVTVE